MTQEIKILLGIGIATLVMVFGAMFLLSKTPSTSPGVVSPENIKLLVREDSQKTGTDSAKVTIVEFSDFQCPACGVAYPVVKKINSDYQGRINFVFRHYPLPQHKNGLKAALAAESAGLQGKFWEMHDRLFDEQEKWSEEPDPVETFVSYARDLGLDVERFKGGMNDKKIAEKIARDQADGSTLGVNSTPTFFINGQKYPGVLGYKDFKSKIDSELNR